MDTPRKPYPTAVTDEEWAFVAPYLTLMDETAPQRRHDLREAFNALRLDRAGGRAVAVVAARVPALGRRPSADQALDRRRPFRGDGPRPAGAGARRRRAESTADRGDFGRTHPAIDAGARAPGGLRRPQAQEGIEGPRRRRHPRPPGHPPGPPRAAPRRRSRSGRRSARGPRMCRR